MSQAVRGTSCFPGGYSLFCGLLHCCLPLCEHCPWGFAYVHSPLQDLFLWVSYKVIFKVDPAKMLQNEWMNVMATDGNRVRTVRKDDGGRGSLTCSLHSCLGCECEQVNTGKSLLQLATPEILTSQRPLLWLPGIAPLGLLFSICGLSSIYLSAHLIPPC